MSRTYQVTSSLIASDEIMVISYGEGRPSAGVLSLYAVSCSDRGVPILALI